MIVDGSHEIGLWQLHFIKTFTFLEQVMTATLPDSQTVTRVTTSYGSCCMHPEFFQLFYRNFTGKSPVIGKLFANTDMELQRHALRAGVTFLMQFAEGSAFAESKVNRLGESHSRKQLSISPEYYPLWLTALLETVAECDPGYDAALAEDWKSVLQVGIDRMIEHY